MILFLLAVAATVGAAKAYGQDRSILGGLAAVLWVCAIIAILR